MASGKKAKKSKGKTVNLNDFLATDNGPTPGQAVVMAPRKISSWADEVDDDIDSYETPKQRLVLPTAPRAARGADVDEEKIPHHPPFLAYVSNLPYDLDEDDLVMFFKDMKIVEVKLPKDDRSDNGKLRGYGYVEFEERSDLKAALAMTDTNLKTRRIRIDVSENDGRRGGMSRGRDYGDRPMTDWRSGPRDDAQPSRGGGRDYGGGEEGGEGGFGRRGGGDRDFGRSGSTAGPWERDRGGPAPERSFDRGGDRGGPERSFNRGGDRGGYDRGGDRGGFGGDRDRGYGGDRDRGYGGDRERGFGGDRGGDRDRGSDRGGFRSFGSDRYEGRDRGGGGFRREEGGGGGGYNRREEGGGGGGYTRREEGGGGGGYRREESGGGEGGENEAPRERPRLNLAPRSKPLEVEPDQARGEEEDRDRPAPSAPSGVSNASIFGGAKPVDTLARELEIEERNAKERAARAAEAEARRAEDDAQPKEASAPKPSWRSERVASAAADTQDEAPRRSDDGPKRSDDSDGKYQPQRGNYPAKSADDRRGDGPPRGAWKDDRRDDRRDDRPTRRPDDRPAARQDDRKIDDKTKPIPERTAKREPRLNDEPRMPKMHEQKAPDYSEKNIFAALPDEDPDCE